MFSSRPYAEPVATPPRPQPYTSEHSKGQSKATSPNTYEVPHQAQTTPKRPVEREVQVSLYSSKNAFLFLVSIVYISSHVT